MSWMTVEADGGEKVEKLLEVIVFRPDSPIITYRRYDPRKPTVTLDPIEKGTNVIINPCTFETLKKVTDDIPYSIASSQIQSPRMNLTNIVHEKTGVITQIYAEVRDNAFLSKVSVGQRGSQDLIQIFSQEFGYTRRPSESLLPEFSDYIFSSKMSVPSTSKGIFCPQILEAEKQAKEEGLGIWEVEEEPEPEDEEETTDIICNSNAYNCGDFSTHEEAQLVFEKCGGKENDVHGLDRDGVACETLG